MAIIDLKDRNGTKTGEALVDDEDFTWLSQYDWRRCKQTDTVYARIDGKTVFMHRFIMSPTSVQQVDHKNWDRLDNRRENLRNCSPSQNQANKKPNQNVSKTSRYRGVHWSKFHQKWIASISILHSSKTLGKFDDELEAALAYDKAAIERWGEFAHPNFP